MKLVGSPGQLWIPKPWRPVFYSRQGELLVEFGESEPIIRAQTIPGFWVRRDWLNPQTLPQVSACLRELLR